MTSKNFSWTATGCFLKQCNSSQKKEFWALAVMPGPFFCSRRMRKLGQRHLRLSNAGLFDNLDLLGSVRVLNRMKCSFDTRVLDDFVSLVFLPSDDSFRIGRHVIYRGLWCNTIILVAWTSNISGLIWRSPNAHWSCTRLYSHQSAVLAPTQIHSDILQSILRVSSGFSQKPCDINSVQKIVSDRPVIFHVHATQRNP